MSTGKGRENTRDTWNHVTPYHPDTIPDLQTKIETSIFDNLGIRCDQVLLVGGAIRHRHPSFAALGCGAALRVGTGDAGWKQTQFSSGFGQKAFDRARFQFKSHYVNQDVKCKCFLKADPLGES